MTKTDLQNMNRQLYGKQL